MKVRGFEVLLEYIDVVDNLPQRGTKQSAGYDVRSAFDVTIPPHEVVLIDTGLTAYMPDDEFLALHIRSGLAFRHNLVLQNATGIIDSDYYGQHIKAMIRNESDEPVFIKAGDRIAQGIFQKYLLADDDRAEGERIGGFGSTGKE